MTEKLIFLLLYLLLVKDHYAFLRKSYTEEQRGGCISTFYLPTIVCAVAFIVPTRPRINPTILAQSTRVQFRSVSIEGV